MSLYTCGCIQARGEKKALADGCSGVAEGGVEGLIEVFSWAKAGRVSMNIQRGKLEGLCQARHWASLAYLCLPEA